MGRVCTSVVVGLVLWVSSSALAEGPSLRVLLVGNSYTRFNIMPVLLQRVARSVPDGPVVEVESAARAGYTLRMHWKRAETRARIRRRAYTHVVLQGHSLSPLTRTAEMADYAARFGHLIDERQARPVLYETWARAPEHRFYAQHGVAGPDAMQRQVVDAYARVAADMSASVAPVGRAFALSRDLAPGLPLLRPDGSHPTVHGSYLAALVLYAAVSGVDPARVTYRPWHVRTEDAAQLRSIASQAVTAAQPAVPAGAALASAGASVDARGGLY